MRNRVGTINTIKNKKFTFVITPNESIDPHRMPRMTAPLIDRQCVLASYGMRSTAARAVHAKRLSARNAVAYQCALASGG
jgi:hypothetical protein